MAPQTEWRGELSRPGRATRMLEKWFAKFNPSDAVLLATGPETAQLVGPLLQLGGTRRIARIVVAGGLEERAAKQLGAAQLAVASQATPESLAAAAGLGPTFTYEDPAALADLHFVSVEFALNPRSKQLEQTPSNITTSVATLMGPTNLGAALLPAAGPAAALPAAQEAPRPASSPKSAGGIATHHLSAGMSFSGLTVQVLSSTPDGQVSPMEYRKPPRPQPQIFSKFVF